MGEGMGTGTRDSAGVGREVSGGRTMTKRKTQTPLERLARDLSMHRTKRELAVMAARYEHLRTLSPRKFSELWTRTMPNRDMQWERFDDVVDSQINKEDTQ